MRTTVLVAWIVATSVVLPARGGGVTVITHGFNGNVEDWIIPMADRYVQYPNLPTDDVSCYEVRVTATDTTTTHLSGAMASQSDSGEVIVKLDWSAVASLFGGRSTTFVAEAATAALVANDLLAELSGRPLAQLPLHLIGHSRGGSVVTEMARLLGAQGIWVDQVTTLDPRPVPPLGDPEIANFANVFFADNYWQDMGDNFLVPNGQVVAGAYNRKLLNLGGGYASSHSDAHLWYHGTIELGTPATDSMADITASERASWWEAGELEGAATGFVFSRIGAGDRFALTEPAGPGTGAVNAGVNRAYDFGAGLADNRVSLPANSGLWPNAIQFDFAAGAPADPTQPAAVEVAYQAGASSEGEVQLDVFLDPDLNPLTGNEIKLDQRLVAKTGTGAVGFADFPVIVDDGARSPGEYGLFIQITDGSRSRLLYAPATVSIGAAPGGDAPFIVPGSLAVSATDVRFDVHASPGQMVTVMATENLEVWTPVATMTFVESVQEFVDSDRQSFTARYYEVEPVP